MTVVVLADDRLQKELTSGAVAEDAIVWAEAVTDFKNYPDADGFIDLLFENLPERIALLTSLLTKPVIINSVVDTLEEINSQFIRVNGWPTFVQSHNIEASCINEALKPTAEALLQAFGKTITWLPDEPGFVTPRVVSMIINEAYFALAECVSTMEEIDTAMKLGTAYPYGPFEWSREIGLQNIATLLSKLSKHQPRYMPAPLLVQETDRAI